MADLPDDISAGIRPLVEALNNAGFETTDSGDGSNHEEGMECAWPEPMVVVSVDHPAHLMHEADALAAFLEECCIESDIQATYSPKDGIASVLLMGPDLVNYGQPLAPTREGGKK